MNDAELIECALCDKQLWFQDSYSPGDEAICAECDTEVTGREHPPTLPPTEEGYALLRKCKTHPET